MGDAPTPPSTPSPGDSTTGAAGASPRSSRPRTVLVTLLVTAASLAVAFLSAPPPSPTASTAAQPSATPSSQPSPSPDPLDPFAPHPDLPDFLDVFSSVSFDALPLFSPSTQPVPPDNSKWLSEITDRVLVRPAAGVSLPTDAVDVGGGWFSVPNRPGLSDDSDFLDSEPVRWVEAFDTPSPPSAAWGLHSPQDNDVDAVEAWARARGRGVVVAVIDTGVDIDHPSLRSRIWSNPGEVCGNGVDDDGNGFVDDCHGWNFAADSPQVFSSAGSDSHGTHIAGIIAASPGSQVAGLAPSARIMVVKFMDGSRGRTDHAAAAINYAVANGADVINISWGSAQPSAAVQTALRNAVDSGVVVFIAAGNHGADLSASPMYPAAAAPLGAAVVAAHDVSGRLASFSAYGSKVDFSAPGVGVVSTLPAGRVGSMSGTSMAAPFAAGAAALYLEAHPSASPSRVVAALTSSAAPRPGLSGRLRSGGILKAAAALGVSQPPPQLSITASEPAAPPSSQVLFSAAATSFDGHPLDVVFTLPDGSTRPGPTVSVTTPPSAGVLSVSASATDARGHSASTSVEVVVSDVAGDFFSHPLPLPLEPASFDTRRATATSIDEKVCVPFGASLFFSLDHLPAGSYSVSTSGSDFDTVLALFDSSGKLLACNDDVSTGVIRHSELTFDLSDSSSRTRGLRLAVGGWSGDSGQLRLSTRPSSAPSPSVLSGPVKATEGDTVSYSAPPGVISVPALGVSGPSPLSVTFPDDGVFAVHFQPADAASAEDSLTVSVANAAPQLSPRIEGNRLYVDVSDPGHDRVEVAVSALSGAAFDSRIVSTPAHLSWPLPPGLSGWLIISAVDEDGAATTAPLSLGFGSGTTPAMPSLGAGSSPLLTVVEASGDVDADGRPDRLRLAPSFDGAVVSAQLGTGTDLRFVDSTGRISPLAARAICAAPGLMFIAQADSASTTMLLRLRFSADGFGSPETVATVSLSALQVSGCRVSDGALLLDTLSGPRRILTVSGG